MGSLIEWFERHPGASVMQRTLRRVDQARAQAREHLRTQVARLLSFPSEPVGEAVAVVQLESLEDLPAVVPATRLENVHVELGGSTGQRAANLEQVGGHTLGIETDVLAIRANARQRAIHERSQLR